MSPAVRGLDCLQFADHTVLAVIVALGSCLAGFAGLGIRLADRRTCPVDVTAGRKSLVAVPADWGSLPAAIAGQDMWIADLADQGSLPAGRGMSFAGLVAYFVARGSWTVLLLPAGRDAAAAAAAAVRERILLLLQSFAGLEQGSLLVRLFALQALRQLRRLKHLQRLESLMPNPLCQIRWR